MNKYFKFCIVKGFCTKLLTVARQRFLNFGRNNADKRTLKTSNFTCGLVLFFLHELTEKYTGVARSRGVVEIFTY